MDVLLRIRVLVWILVLALWGIMVYQFLGEDDQPQVQYVSNPYRTPVVPRVEPPIETPAPPPAEEQQPPPDDAALSEGQPVASSLLGVPPAPAAPPQPSSLDYIKPLKAIRLPARRYRPSPPMAEERPRLPDPAIPPGFVKTVTRHFNVYSEGGLAPQDVLDMLEELHGNLMLDLAAFSPWADDQRVSIYLFRSQDTYREVTGRPAWSGGASSVAKRKIFVYESDELRGILAHELCHIYYDGFYLDGHPDPLWLSEGMATLIQVERGMAAPNWLRDNLQILEEGGGYSLPQLMSVTTTAGSSDDRVRLWYAESYSVVRFLLRTQYRSSFYHFSEYLREGKDPTQALYRAYGMPYNRLKALEYAWRYDLTSRSMTRLSAAQP